jgi:hypothetical protein
MKKTLGLIALAAAFGIGLPGAAVAQEKGAAKKSAPEAKKGAGQQPPAPQPRKKRYPKKNAAKK